MSVNLHEESSLPNFELDIKLVKLAQGRSEEQRKKATQQDCAEHKAKELLISAGC